MKILAISLIAGMALVSNLVAQSQVNYSAAPGQRSVHTLDGAAVADGNTVWIGAFNSGFSVGAFANRPQDLLANWREFGSTTISTIATQPGRFTGSASSFDAFFPNKQIYLWIFSTIDGGAPDTVDFSNVDEYGLFSANLANWTFSPDPPPSNLRTINSSQVNQNLFGSADSTRLFLSGGFITVPEPSTLGLLSIAIPAIVLALRKRRTQG
jgi:hypothetical protein